MKHLKVFILALGIVGLRAAARDAQGADRVQLSFDTLFPETASKQLYDTMLQLWSDVTLLHDETVPEKSKRDIADMVVGQLVRIGYLIEYMKTRNNMLNQEDIAYLQSIANGLATSFDSFFKQQHITLLWQAIINGFQTLAHN